MDIFSEYDTVANYSTLLCDAIAESASTLLYKAFSEWTSCQLKFWISTSETFLKISVTNNNYEHHYDVRKIYI